MSNDHNFLVTYGLHNYVTHAVRDNKHTFTIRAQQGQKMIRHAKALIDGFYGAGATVQIA